MKRITDESISNFKGYLLEEEKAANTIEKYLRDILCFQKWLDGRMVDKSLVIQYKKELCDKYAPRSVNSVLSSLNSFFMYMNCCYASNHFVSIFKFYYPVICTFII